MKTENTLEHKQSFFAKYWNWIYEGESVCVNIEDTQESDFLELKPLSQITDEDAIEVFDAVYPNSLPVSDYEKTEAVKGVFESEFRPHKFLDLSESSSFIDACRRFGYALPFDGLSVEDQIEYGWIKLKNNTD